MTGEDAGSGIDWFDRKAPGETTSDAVDKVDALLGKIRANKNTSDSTVSAEETERSQTAIGGGSATITELDRTMMGQMHAASEAMEAYARREEQNIVPQSELDEKK